MREVEEQEMLDGFLNFDAVVAHNRSSAQPYTGDNSNFQGQLLGSNGFRNDGVSREVSSEKSLYELS